MKYLFLFIIMSLNTMSQLNDIGIVVQSINDTCQYGEQIIFRDTNKDNQFDKIRRSFCDFSQLDDSLVVYGNGELLSGMTGKLLEGNLNSNYFKVKIIDPFANVIYAYLSYDSTNNFAILNFVPTNIEYEEEEQKLSLYPNPAESIINIMFKDFNANKSVDVFDYTGKHIDRINITNKHLIINISYFPGGIYFIKYKNKFYSFVKFSE